MAATIKEQLANVDMLRAELDRLRPLKQDQEQRVVQKLRLDWNYHSNAIEGNQLTAGETRLLLLEGITADGKPLKDYLDIKGHNHAIDYLLDFIKRKEEFSEAIIRELHKLLLVQSYQVTAITPDGGQTKKWVRLGQYKQEPNQVKTATGEIHRFVLPEETPDRMHALVSRIRGERENLQIHPVVFAALIHHEFVSIHPFDDGNGRMGRLIMNLLLMQRGFPPAVIRLQDRQQYFATLAQADSGELEALPNFIAEQVARSLEIYLRAARGEDFEDYDDIDKKIALLKQELGGIPEPKTLSPEVYAEFIRNSLTRLMTKVLKKLTPFDDMYLSSQLIMNKGGVQQEISKSIPDIQKNLLGTGVHNSIVFQLHWKEFKKAGLRPFSDGQVIYLNFHPLKYQVVWGKSNKRKEKLYADELTDEDCLQVANGLAEECYENIQRERAKAV